MRCFGISGAECAFWGGSSAFSSFLMRDASEYFLLPFNVTLGGKGSGCKSNED